MYRKNKPSGYWTRLSTIYADPGVGSYLPLWCNLVSLRLFIKSLEVLCPRFVFFYLILVFVVLDSISAFFLLFLHRGSGL